MFIQGKWKNEIIKQECERIKHENIQKKQEITQAIEEKKQEITHAIEEKNMKHYDHFIKKFIRQIKRDFRQLRREIGFTLLYTDFIQMIGIETGLSKPIE